ncbi:PREDICTED: uncharacterized protein LOC105316469 [Amphimedon queenslandica]|uniref:G-protein coupled receptors family 1 profile domain-containing protein n=1 Tax=Amphimedon queenslandica TaxID=400682 RepID=A0A1X7VN47_AMPQE|nr:PREDICTED: uncharacterized protein LOC105316469 [Amphimedon queenslandica]|eukprot:XP_011409682.1 PREDICTED: uncharacterized protein LOC105316469 [Amphimedon queenslandica]
MYSASECFDYIDNITADKPSYFLLFLISPVDSTVWGPRPQGWLQSFIGFTAIFSFIFFFIGLMSVMLIIKRDCARLKTKTFLAIYICLAVLGFTHTIHLSLDPNGILGWIVSEFPEWIIISRFLQVSGFPSITATYTLVFITLYKSVEIGSSRLWHRDWRVVTILVMSHYLVAYASEIIANVGGYFALAAVIICEFGLAVWGIVTCLIYFFTGRRLLRKLKNQCQMSVRMSSSVSARDQCHTRKPRLQETQSVLTHEHYSRQYNKISHTLRKVTIITYFTSVLTVLYATVSLVSLFFNSWFIFYDCIGLNGVGDPVMFLVLRIISKTIEIPLAMTMLYSVTDFQSVLNVMCFCFSCQDESEESKNSTVSPPGSSTNIRSNSAESMANALTASQLSLTALGPHVINTETPSHVSVSVESGDNTNVAVMV